MHYSKLSNYEINKLVAIKRHYKIINNKPTPNKGILVVSNGVTTGAYDPCNNPSDAWPIILENKITVDPTGKAWQHKPRPLDYFYHAGICNNVSDKNPLRAAMIVYLMIQEVK